MEKLVDILKILTGRKLSVEGVQRASLGREPYPFSHLHPQIFRRGDKIVSVTVRSAPALTEDISYGAQLLHFGVYEVGSETRVYNGEGLLEERTISTNPPNGSPTSVKTWIYKPAGSWFGRRIGN